MITLNTNLNISSKYQNNPTKKTTAFSSPKMDCVTFGRQKIIFCIKPKLLKEVKATLSLTGGEKLISHDRKITLSSPQKGFWNKIKSFFKTDFVLTNIKKVQYHYEKEPRDESKTTKFSLVRTLKGYSVKIKSVEQKCSILGPEGSKTAYMVLEDRLAGMKAGQALEDLVSEKH